MRRQKKTTKCTRIFPILHWMKCFKCNRKFGLERGYESYEKGFWGVFHSRLYLCNNCCNSPEKADKMFAEKRAKLPKSKWPPPPPPPRRIDNSIITIRR